MTPQLPEIVCRDARVTDAGIITLYNQRLALETEGRGLEPARVDAGVRALLEDPAKGRYFVAEVGRRVVGQVGLTWEWSDWRNGVFWWFQSVYVEAGFRRLGVFTRLFRHVEECARVDAACCGLRLYVEHHNAPAQAVYARLGMRHAGFEVLEIDFTGMPVPRRP